MLQSLAVLAGAFVLTLLLASVGQSQTVCLDQYEMLARLRAEHGEMIRYTATHSAGWRVFVLVDRAGNWSMVYQKAGGIACLVGEGTGWVSHVPAAGSF
jgi:hypothetical protein